MFKKKTKEYEFTKKSVQNEGEDGCYRLEIFGNWDGKKFSLEKTTLS